MCLAWALCFAQADLAAWRDGDWLNALEDAEGPAIGGGNLLGQPGERVRGTDEAPAGGAPGGSERVLPAYRPGETACARFPRLRGGRVWGASPAQVLAAAFYVGSTGRGLRVQFEPGNESPAGAFITWMVLRVADLLTRVDLSRVKRCPECKRLYPAM